MTLRTRALAVAGAALSAAAVAAAPAVAATPANGAVDLENLRVDWTGEATGSAIQYAHFFYDAQIVDDCVAPICDSFTLTVGPGAKKLVISAEDASGYTEMQIKDSAGNEIFYSTGDDAVPTVYSKSNPKAGTYTVEVLTDALAPVVDDGSYSAFAELTPPPPPAPAPTPVPPATTEPGTGGTSAKRAAAKKRAALKAKRAKSRRR